MQYTYAVQCISMLIYIKYNKLTSAYTYTYIILCISCEQKLDVKNILYAYHSHSLILSAPSGTRGDSKGSPSGSVCCCSGGHVETQSPDIEVLLHVGPPCLSWSSSLSLALRCPSEGCSGDGVGGHAVDMS